MDLGGRLLMGTFCAGTVAAASLYVGRRRERARLARLSGELLKKAPCEPASKTITLESLSPLPVPVQRYFRNVLAKDQDYIGRVWLRQSGMLRGAGREGKWRAFQAHHLVSPWRRGFFWNARIAMPFGLHVNVQDSYVAGSGAARVALMSAFPVACEADVSELNSAALHRFLAEAPWYPTALLPGSGVMWEAIDGNSALATLTDNGTTVSLEFHFNPRGEIATIYTSGRFMRGDGGYRRVPWEGHFRDYQVCCGMRVPRYGEVGWYDGGALQLVWKGNLTELKYEFVQ